MIDIVIRHECIILDACCLINLFASGRPKDILKSLATRVFVARYVWRNEGLSINGAPNSGTGFQETRIDLQPLIDCGLISLAEFESEAEDTLFVNFAAYMDDGEAITGAIAAVRNWCIATDDKRALNVFSQQAPHIQLMTSPELVKRWADVMSASADEVGSVVNRIRQRGHYIPPANHCLYDWWLNHLS